MNRLCFALLSLTPFLTSAAQESPSARLAWGDFDGDGLSDVFVADSHSPGRLLQNMGGGLFVDVSARSLPPQEDVTRLALWRDVDQDQRLDLFLVSAQGRARLLTGTAAGTFFDGSSSRGLAQLPQLDSARFTDWDRDGWPDLEALTTGGRPLLLRNSEGVFLGIDLGLSPANPPATGPAKDGEAPIPPPLDVDAGVGGDPLPGPGGQAMTQGACASAIEDAAAQGNCLSASSVPTLGMLWPLGTELFIDAFTNYVGIGTLQPQAALDVSGTARMSGFQLTAGAEQGLVLTSDADGVGSWQVSDSGNTLDKSYDQGNPGAGRLIQADAGAVEIAASGDYALLLQGDGVRPAMRALNGGSASCVFADILQGTGACFSASHNGAGHAIKGSHGATGNTLNVEHSGSGNAVDATVLPIGTGAGVAASIQNAASVKPAVDGETQGPGSGVRGYSSSPASTASGVLAEGDGVNGPGAPRAAAVDIRNGAIVVSGEERPAGRLYMPTLQFELRSCESGCAGCNHDHVVGHYGQVTLANDLIKPDSLIYLTVEDAAEANRSFFAEVIDRQAGLATIRVSAVGGGEVCDPFAVSASVGYLIINPAIEQ